MTEESSQLHYFFLFEIQARLQHELMSSCKQSEYARETIKLPGHTASHNDVCLKTGDDHTKLYEDHQCLIC